MKFALLGQLDAFEAIGDGFYGVGNAEEFLPLVSLRRKPIVDKESDVMEFSLRDKVLQVLQELVTRSACILCVGSVSFLRTRCPKPLLC
jgi:hypothetical protein